jgi:hypothetical protein
VSAVDQDVDGWPPALVAYGADEMFRDPIREFVAHLEAAGIETVALEEPGMFHVFPILMPWAEASRRVFRAVAGFVADRLSAADAGAPADSVTPADAEAPLKAATFGDMPAAAGQALLAGFNEQPEAGHGRGSE